MLVTSKQFLAPFRGYFEFDDRYGSGDGNDNKRGERNDEGEESDENKVKDHFIVNIELTGDDVPMNLTAFCVLDFLCSVRKRLNQLSKLSSHHDGCQNPPHCACAHECVDMQRANNTEAAFHSNYHTDAARRRLEAPAHAQAVDKALGVILGSNDFVNKRDNCACRLNYQHDQIQHVDDSQAEQTQVHAITEPLSPEHHAAQYVGGDTDQKEHRV